MNLLPLEETTYTVMHENKFILSSTPRFLHCCPSVLSTWLLDHQMNRNNFEDFFFAQLYLVSSLFLYVFLYFTDVIQVIQSSWFMLSCRVKSSSAWVRSRSQTLHSVTTPTTFTIRQGIVCDLMWAAQQILRMRPPTVRNRNPLGLMHCFPA